MLPTEFRCKEYTKRVEIKLNYTNYRRYAKCPYAYYLSVIEGYQRKPHMTSIQIRRGSAFHQIISHVQLGLQPKSDIYFAEPDETREIVKILAIVEAMKELKLIPVPYARPEIYWKLNESDMPRLYGIIDLLDSTDSEFPVWFAEMKYTEKPDFYLNSILATTQLATYMLAFESLSYAWIRPVRVPILRSTGQYVDEDEDSYKERLVADILRRPKFYFPYYDKEKSTWGVKYYRENFPLGDIKKHYRMAALDIARDVKRGYFRQNESACLSPAQCEFYELCTAGGPSEFIYERRGRNEDMEAR